MKLLVKFKPSFVIWLSIITLISGLLMTCRLFAQQQFDPKFYLDHIIDAQQTQSFTGVFNYSRPSYSVEHYIYQYITKDGKAKEWVKLRGKEDGFVLVDRQVVCVTKGYNSNFRAKTILQSLQKEGIDNLLQGYTIVLYPKDIQVGNRLAKELVFTAKDDYRYTYKLAFDKSTFFPLQYIFLDNKNNILESGQFSQYDPVTDNKVVIKPFHGCMKIKRLESKVTQSSWLVTWKPVGFDLERVVIDPQTHNEQLIYSDGLVLFSVFFEHLSDPRMTDIERHFGATAVVSRKVNLPRSGKYLVTVVGEIPYTTAERIALSVQKQIVASKP